jgi:hypothetical protein
MKRIACCLVGVAAVAGVLICHTFMPERIKARNE